MDLSELRKRSNSFVNSIGEFIEAAVDLSRDELVQLNRDQMLKSIDSKGKKILPKYSKSYAAKKGFSSPNLKVTGAFQGAMVMQTRGNQFDISSEDEKKDKLVYGEGRHPGYGEDIFGIAPDNQPKAQAKTTDELSKLYKKNVL